MSVAAPPDLAGLDLSDLALWRDGPPHTVFARLREADGLHWSPLEGFAHERGFYSAVRFADIAEIGRDHATFSSEAGGILAEPRPCWCPEFSVR